MITRKLLNDKVLIGYGGNIIIGLVSNNKVFLFKVDRHCKDNCWIYVFIQKDNFMSTINHHHSITLVLQLNTVDKETIYVDQDDSYTSCAMEIQNFNTLFTSVILLMPS